MIFWEILSIQKFLSNNLFISSVNILVAEDEENISTIT